MSDQLPRKPTRFDHFLKRAGKLVASREEIRDLTTHASDKLKRTSGWSAKLAQMRQELELLIGLLGAYYRGEYTDVSKRTLVTVTAGVLYFLMPFDVVPDFILGFGFLDDAAVIGYVIAAVRGEIDAYRKFTEEKQIVEEEQDEFET